MDKKTEALKLALESLVDNRHYIVANERTEYLEIYDKSIDAVEKALAEQQAQQEMTEKELSNGLAMALHDAVLIRVGGNDEATRQACARIDKLVDKYRAEKPEIKPAHQDMPKIGCVNHDCDKCKAQQQEPVAWIDICEKGQMSGLRYWSEPDNRHEVPLYTSPPASKPWVGLDQHDIDVLFLNEDGVRFARYIEAKLKEKNT